MISRRLLSGSTVDEATLLKVASVSLLDHDVEKNGGSLSYTQYM